MKRIFVLFGLSMLAALAGAADPPATASDSLYALQPKLVNQDGKTVSLDQYRGQVVIVTMFYATCPGACPLLIESIRATESALTPHARLNTRVLMISIDPVRDTPAALSALARERHVDTNRWTLATATAADVREIAAALNIQYRRLPNGEYNHTSVLTLLTHEGEMVEQSSILGKADKDFVAAVERTVARRKP